MMSYPAIILGLHVSMIIISDFEWYVLSPFAAHQPSADMLPKFVVDQFDKQYPRN